MAEGWSSVFSEKNAQELRLRVFWGVILGLITIFICIAGSPYVDGYIMLVYSRLGYEWIDLNSENKSTTRNLGATLLILGLVILFCLSRWGGTWWSLGSFVTIIMSTFLIAPGKYRNWSALGAFYLGMPLMAIAWVLNYFKNGALFLLWVILLVVLTDVCAYFAGKRFKGPRLAPKWSPNKTWSGFWGGIFGGLLGSITGLFFCPKCPLAMLLCFGAIISLTAIMGDLFESYIKRYHGVKDASPLIPGHGGLLDRADAILLAVPMAVALIRLFPGKLPFVLLP